MATVWKNQTAGEAVRARDAQFLAYWPVAHEQSRLSTSQGETFVIASGALGAPAVLLLYRSLSNSSSWMGDIAARSKHFRVYAIDMIGQPGFSAPSRPPLASEVYAIWLEEVLAALGEERAALVGISLGGWLALDFATRRPDRVTALLCPGGVGKTRNVRLWVAPLMLLGPWGRKMVLRKLGAVALTENASPAVQAFGAFMRLIQTSTRPRREQLPRFSDAALAGLRIPLLAILGATDRILDSHATRRRLTAKVAQANVCWLPDAGHFLVGHGATIDALLAKALLP